MPRNDITAKFLKELYYIRLLSKKAIALQLKCNITTVHKKMIKFGIPKRKQAEAVRIAMSKKVLRIDKFILENLYLRDKFSITQIAKKLGHDSETIKRALIRNKIQLRTKAVAIKLALGKKKIKKHTLENLYHKNKLTQKEIAEKLNKSRGYILRLMKEYKIKTRGPAQTQLRYPKFNFSEDLGEKSYLIGFRLGDLNVKLSPSGNLVLVNCTSSKPVQIKLFRDLFKKYGFVWISQQRKDGNRVFLVRLNHTFDFLLPKKDKIPEWILKKDNYFLNFFAGYTDAEGCIGVFNGLARYTLASYDKNILRQIYKQLNQIGIECNPPRILVKKGYQKSDGYIYRNDHWHFTVTKKSTLLMLFRLLGPYLRHQKRLRDLDKARRNIIKRNENLGISQESSQVLAGI